MNRRTAIRRLATFFLTTASLAEAQQTGKIFRIGFLDGGTAAGSADLVKVFLRELSKLGWIEGKNIAIEYRFVEGKPERRAELAADLVRLKVDLIVVTAGTSALAAARGGYSSGASQRFAISSTERSPRLACGTTFEIVRDSASPNSSRNSHPRRLWTQPHVDSR